MLIKENPIWMKSLRILFTMIVTLVFLLGSIAPASAYVDSRSGSLDVIAVDPNVLFTNVVEDDSTTWSPTHIEDINALEVKESIIDRDRMDQFSLTMPQLENRERNIIVYLPSDYQAGNNSYPVIYVLCAQELFVQLDISSGDQVINESLNQFYTHPNEREAIIVGIEADPIHMWDEYSPWVNRNMYLWMDPYDANEVEGGEGDAFLDFLVNSLKPVIDTRYRTLSDRENTSISGTKMGGLLALYGGLTRPEIFSRVMAMSPEVWFAESGGTWLSNNRLLKFIDNAGVPEGLTFFLDVDARDRVTDLVVRPAVFDSFGEKISFPQAYLEGTQSVVNKLFQKGGSISSTGDGISVPAKRTSATSMLLGEGDVFHTYLPIIMKPVIPPVITSASWTIFTVSSQNSFTITTTGDPTSTIMIAEELPAGVSFVDNGDGTATLSGAPSELGTTTLTIIASNDLTPAVTQTFLLNVVDYCPNSGSCLLTFLMDMSPYLNRTRKISVYLPPNYNSGADFPVIYLTDAQHIFGAQIGSPVEDRNDWKMDETLDSYYRSTGRGIIAVGIWFDIGYAWSEYTLTMNLNMDHWIRSLPPIDNPQGGQIIDFIRWNLKPEIDSLFHTLPDRDHTAIGGGSRGALLALYAGLVAPETFSKVMAMSPAVWMAEGGPRIDFPAWPTWFSENGLQAWFDANPAPKNVQYYLYIGESEDEAEEPAVFTPERTRITWRDAYLNGAVRVRDNLIYREDVKSIKYIQWEPGTHRPDVWRLFTNQVLTWFGY